MRILVNFFYEKVLTSADLCGIIKGWILRGSSTAVDCRIPILDLHNEIFSLECKMDAASLDPEIHSDLLLLNGTLATQQSRIST